MLSSSAKFAAFQSIVLNSPKGLRPYAVRRIKAR